MDNCIVIYHGYCSDGLGAAWAFRRAMPDATFHAATHIAGGNSPPPDVTGKEVYIVDYAYSRETLLDMKMKAKSLVLLDHHKSAMERLSDLDFCHFDMNRSGAGIAWDYLFPNEPRHWIINYIEDKDIWRWTQPNSREVNCNMQSYPVSFETLDFFATKNAEDFVAEGAAILRHQRNMVTDIVKKAREVEVQGHKVLMVNSPVLQSEVAAYLAHNRPFGIAWFENEGGEKVYSLRSTKEGIDVAKIAMVYPGGGGHARASGFRLSAGTPL
jgi:oligoribonuclease NrnB/cAMP/cGMP phosphodiesterase (DHH superfamily)